jgi:hypothetical protein
MTFQQWADSSGGGTRQLGFTDNDNLWIRGSGSGLTSYGSWKLFLNSSNYNSYAPTLTGTGASGTWGISITGNAATATSATTAGNVTGTVAIANGGTGATTAANALTNLGAYPASNPSGYTSNTGTVTSVSGTGGYGGLTLSGTVASSGSLTLGGTPTGTWPISVSGSAASTTRLDQQATFPTANNQDFNSLTTGGYYNIVWGNYSGTLNTPPASNSYGTLFVEAGANFITQTYTPYNNNSSPCIRTYYNGTWTSWNITLTSANYNSYSPTLTGGGASGTWGINITGNAATATSATSATTAGNVTGTVAIANGGTGATTAANALTNLGALPSNNGTATSLTLGVRVNGTTFGGNTSGMSGYYFPVEVRANGAKPTLTWHYENVATRHIALDADGALDVYNPGESGGAVFKVGGNTSLHAGNYNSYAPTLTGTGASGTWGISITGNAATVTNGVYTSGDQTTITGTKRFYSTNNTQINTVSATDRGLSVFQETAGADAYMTFHVSNDYASYFGLGGAENDLVYGGWSAGSVRHRILHSGNYTGWAPSLTGSGASGTWGISITGNAATATSADQIDGVAFRNTGSNSAVNADTLDSNGITYYTSGVSNFSGNATDGALYSQVWSPVWQHQIAGDYRSGQIAVRGKNNGTWQSWRTVLDSGNYNSYAPTLTGTGASGTWGINITGNAATSTSTVTPTFSGDATSKADITTRTDSGFYETDSGTTAEGWPVNSGTYQHMIACTHTNDGNYYSMQIGGSFYDNVFYGRKTNGTGATTWVQFLTSGNYNSYSPTLTGTGASGTWGINITGNAATVTNGVVTTGSYADPSWITSLAYSKLTGGPTLPTGAIVGTTDTQTLDNKTLTEPTIVGTIIEDRFTITDGASVDIDPANGSIQSWTLGGNRTPTATNWVAGESITLMIVDGTAFTINWTTIGVNWIGGSPPTLSTTTETVIQLWKRGSTVFGALVGFTA